MSNFYCHPGRAGGSPKGIRPGFVFQFGLKTCRGFRRNATFISATEKAPKRWICFEALGKRNWELRKIEAKKEE